MREFVELFKVTGQDEGISQIQLSYEKYKSDKVIYAFDIDGELGSKTGVLSLIKRETRLEVRFSESLTSSIKAIVIAQYDNLITIDSDRQVTIDY